ncbi:MAG: DUF2905 domain-containing protein [Betaproteobacteria bacterium]|nr:DUF2905 domain-containing protein [Betaproteobacteria bacterium]
MLRWMIIIFLALVVLSWLTPWLNKLGVGQLPGDFRFKLFGRQWYLPFASTVLLSFVVTLISMVF